MKEFKNLFPVPVYFFKDEELAEKAIPIADSLLKEKRLINKTLSMRAGPNSSITLNKTDISSNRDIRIISKVLLEYCKEYLRYSGMSDAICIEKSSIYINNIGLYGSQESHFHCASPVTGVFYLDVEPESAPLVIENPNSYTEYFFQNYIKEKKLGCQFIEVVTPSKGQGVIFPGWLKHRVCTNYTNYRPVLTFVFYY